MAIVHDAVAESMPDVKRIKNWKTSLEVLTHGGNDTRQVLYELMMGKPFQAVVDGQLSMPYVPTPEVRLRAAIFLHEQMYGRAVPQTEINKADAEAREQAAVHALTDEELAAEAEKILASRRLPAETTVDVLPSVDECAQMIWDAKEDEWDTY
jgi:hypothetical protein